MFAVIAFYVCEGFEQIEMQVKTVECTPSLLCLQTCMRKLGPIIYSQNHSALSKLAFLVDSIQKKRCPGKKKNIQER